MLNNRFNISTPLVASLVALGLGGLIVLVYFFGVVVAIVGPGTGDVEPDAMLAKYVSRNDKQLEEYEQGFNGRSVFYIPPARRAAPTPVVQREEPQVEYIAPAPPPTPTTYNGPTPAWAMGSEVWFREKKQGDPMLRLRVGEEVDGVELVRTNLPKEIVVRQHGKEFVLPMLRGIDWVDNADKVLASDAGKSKGTTLDGMKVVGPDGQTGSNEPTVSATDLERPNSAAMQDEEFVGPPVPDDLVEVEDDSESLPMPDIDIEINNDLVAPEAVPVDSQGTTGGGNVDAEAEQAAQNEAGDGTTGNDEDESEPQQSGSDDPDDPGPPPE